MAVVVDEEDLGTVTMAAACWVMGIPYAQNENTPGLVEQIERMADEVGVSFKEGWWDR